MGNKITTKKIAVYSLLIAFALLCILMLCFSTMYACKTESEYFYPDADNGFVWISFESNIAYGPDWETYSVPLGLFSIFQLIYGLVALVLIIMNFASNKDVAKNKGIIIGGFISMLLYAIEGIVYHKVYCEIMNYKTSYFATAAYIPLIIGAVLIVGAVLLEKCLKDNDAPAPTTDNSVSQPSVQKVPVAESEAINNLAQYKKLLDDGVITQEEFETKKKQLLGL